MGKDGDKGAGSSTASRDDLKAEHAHLVEQEKNLKLHHEEIQAVFLKLDEAYAASKGSFSIQRYGQLKDMIKETASEATINKLKQGIQVSKGNQSQGSGLSSLLQKAKDFASESEQSQDEAQASKPKGKMSSFMKRLKNFTGFNDEPITDEDVMTPSQIQRDNARKQRSIQHMQAQLTKALARLEKLQHDYQASKSLTPPKRYQELKNMIKEATAEKMT